MLQNRKLQIALVWLIIAITHSEQRQQIQGQAQGRRNSQPPQTRQLEQRKMQEREHKAREILKYMNTEADVCKDFYEYTCGNWLKEQNTDMTNEGELISVQSEMEKFVNKQLQAILNEPITSQDSMATKVIKDFYKACLRVPASSPAQKQFIMNFVANHGGLPNIRGTHWQANYNWLYIIATLRRNFGFDILIGLTIEKSNPNHKAIFIEEPQTTLLPVELCSSLATRQIGEQDEMFEKIEKEVKENLKNWFQLNESNAMLMAGDIIRFEFDLCKYMRLEQTATTPLENEEEERASKTNRRGYSTVENKMHGLRVNAENTLQSLRTLSEMYAINFKDFVDNSLDTATISQVYFRSTEYFRQLSRIAENGTQASFANYIMYRALSEMNFPLNERRGQRPFYCTNQISRHLPQVLGKLYNEKFNTMDAKQDVHEIFLVIKQAFAKYLQTEVNWMSDNTKRAIKQKLNTLKIIYPSYTQNEDFIRGFSSNNDQDYYWHKLQSLMMYNANQSLLQVRSTNDHYNLIEAPAVSIQQKPLNFELVVGYGLLQKSFYSQFYPASLKYSSVGVAIAREIVKIFDLQGLQQNPMNTFPWDPSTMENFSVISECFRAQLSNYLHNEPNVFRNASKLRDVMAETSALNIAFNAYLLWLELPARQGLELHLETLRDINFTNTQLFFINFAQTHCGARSKVELSPDFLPLSRRTLEQYDINGPLSNSAEFAREFACILGTDMNLDDKCVLY